MPSIALLAAGLAMAGAPQTHVPLGVGMVPLEASLELRTATRTSRIALAFQTATDGALVARAENGEWEAVVAFAPAPGGARQAATLPSYLQYQQQNRAVAFSCS